MLKIDANTKYDEFVVFEPYMAEGERERLEQTAVAAVFGSDGFMNMTVGQMLDAMRGDFSSLLRAKGESVFDVYRARAFASFITGFIERLKAVTLQPTAEDIAVKQGTLSSTFEESVYTFCRSYFQLPTFAAVDDLKVADYLLAKRDDFNRSVVERNITNRMKGGKK